MTENSGPDPFQEIDPAALAGFRAGLRRRYSDEEILAALRECAGRLGRSPTMRDLVDDPEAGVHPQTVVGRFGSWNAAKRLAGLSARRFATREELLEQLRALGNELGRAPTGRTSRRAAAARHRSRSSGRRLARSRTPCVRPGSTSRAPRIGPSVRSHRASCWHAASDGCRASPTGPRLAARMPRC